MILGEVETAIDALFKLDLALSEAPEQEITQQALKNTEKIANEALKILINESIDKPQSLSATDTVERIAGLITLQKPSDCCDRIDEALFDILLNVSAVQSGALACSQSITLDSVVTTWLRKNKALR